MFPGADMFRYLSMEIIAYGYGLSAGIPEGVSLASG